MTEPELLRFAILERLSKVIDSETGLDVVRMRLIQDLVVDGNGRVSYKFRPSSPLCPIVIPLSQAIQQAVAQVEGVMEQDVDMVGMALSDELNVPLKQMLAARQNSERKSEHEEVGK